MAIALALLAGAAGVARAQDDDGLHSPLGLVDQFLHEEAVEVGSSWMRQHILWRYFEPTDGTFATGYETDLEELEAHGLRMSPVLAAGKCWATHEAGDPWDPENPDTDFPSGAPVDLAASFHPTHAYSATYYDFVYEFVSRYGERIDRITIENEANTSVFWEDTAEQYIRLLVTARKAARDANPLVLVFDSGMGSGSWGAPIAQERYQSGAWTWEQARDFLVDYYERDVYVTLPAINTESQLQGFFASGEVAANYQRVTYILTHLYSSQLGDMLVDGLNVKYTGEPWMLGEVIRWIDEKIDSVPAQTPLPLKVNNEASSWCPSRTDYDPVNRICLNLAANDWRALTSEMIQKIVVGRGLGLVQSLWFPFSNCLPGNCPIPNEPSPRLGLIDYAGDRQETFLGYVTMSRFIGGNRDFVSADSLAGGDVPHFVFSERVTGRQDVHVLWWDDGGHGAGAATVTLPVPENTIRVSRFTQSGDSTDVPFTTTVEIADVRREPTFVYFDDGVTPIEWPLDPTVGPAPPAVVLSAPAPNPSPGWTRLRFGLPSDAGDAELGIFDLAGREVSSLRTGPLTEGTYTVIWDGRTSEGVEAANGIYFVKLSALGKSFLQKLVLAR